MKTLLRILFTIMALAPLGAAAQVAAPGECVMESWGGFLAPEPQTFQRREQIETDAGPVYAIEFGELKGEYAKVFLFLLDGENCFTKAVSFGSYALTNMLAEEGRIYHLDLYLPGEHVTLGFFDQPIPYEQAREMAIAALK